MTNLLDTFTDTELARAVDRAYWQAAREFQEARAAGPDIRGMLYESAASSQQYWHELNDEQQRRVARAVGYGKVTRRAL